MKPVAKKASLWASKLPAQQATKSQTKATKFDNSTPIYDSSSSQEEPAEDGSKSSDECPNTLWVEGMEFDSRSQYLIDKDDYSLKSKDLKFQLLATNLKI